MKQNEYEPAEAMEIARADDIILGSKDLPGLDCTIYEPRDRYCDGYGGFE